MIKNVETVVIGAGLTGLATAYFLKKKNRSFLVLEKTDRPGGVIRTCRDGDFLYEKGPNTGIVGTAEIARLFDEIGRYCAFAEANDNVNRRLILHKGKWEALPAGVFEGIKTPLFTLKDKIRLLGEPFRNPVSDPEENLADMVVRRMGKSFLDYAIDPFILGVYAGDPQYLIPRYAFPKLYSLEQKYGSFIGGAIRKKFEKKSSIEKSITRKVFSTENGLEGLTEALYKITGEDHFMFHCNKINIKPDNKTFKVVYRKNNKDHLIEAKHVITTIPAFELADILEIAETKIIRDVTDVKYAPVIQVAVGFRKWKGMPLDAFGGLIPFRENRPLLGILFMSSLFKKRAPEKGALLSVFMGGVRRPEIAKMPEDRILTILKKEIPDLLNLPLFKPDLLRIIRYNYAIPQYGRESKHRFYAIR
jgi:oxygen-dependent protoporphyrinogen oxidase